MPSTRASDLTPRRRRKRERARTALRDAARTVFERKGYAQATLRDIVEAADVTHPTFYKYFASKDQVLADLIDELIDGILDIVTEVGFARAGKGATSSLRGQFRSGLHAVLDLAQRNRRLLVAIRQAINANEAHEATWGRFRSRSMFALKKDLGWAKRRGLIRADDVEVLSVAMIATIEAALFELAAREDKDPEVVEDVLEAFFWNALFGWRGGPVDYAVSKRGVPTAVRG